MIYFDSEHEVDNNMHMSQFKKLKTCKSKTIENCNTFPKTMTIHPTAVVTL